MESPAGRPVDREKGNAPTPTRTESAADGAWSYQLATDVPVRIEAASPEVVLRRGTIAGASGGAHQARGRILEPERAFVVNEEEIPSGGVRVDRRRQLARSADGELHLWVRRHKRPPGGLMRRTPLRFDSIAGIETSNTTVTTLR